MYAIIFTGTSPNPMFAHFFDRRDQFELLHISGFIWGEEYELSSMLD